jgi:hypothetical protein
MSRNICFSQVQISYNLRFISISDIFTDSPSYMMTCDTETDVMKWSKVLEMPKDARHVKELLPCYGTPDHYRVYKSLPLAPVSKQVNAIHILPSCFKTHLILPYHLL